MEVSQLFIYPVKSFRGIQVTSALIGARGFENDRRWMVVDEGGLFVTGRKIPSMVSVIPELTDDPQKPLILSCGGKKCVVQLMRSNKIKVKVWEDVVVVWDCGDVVADFLTKFFGQTVRLVEYPQDNSAFRRVEEFYLAPVRAMGVNDQSSFADGFPYLIVNEASLDAVNQIMAAAAAEGQVTEPLTMRRFRPNVVIKFLNAKYGSNFAFDEDWWNNMIVQTQEGLDAEFYCVKACSRCKFTTVDPINGAVMTYNAPANPLKYLSQNRNWGRGGLFGQNSVPTNSSVGLTIRVGDKARVTSRKTVEQCNRDRFPRAKAATMSLVPKTAVGWVVACALIGIVVSVVRRRL